MTRAERLSRRLEKPAWAVLILAFALLLSPGALDAIGRIEGQIAPVLDPTLTIENVRAEPGSGHSVVVGSAFKTRGDCSYLEGTFRWYFGERNGLHVEVPAAFRDPPTLRGAGMTRWEGIVVGLGERDIRGLCYATVQHECPNRPWPVTSLFYQAPPANSVERALDSALQHHGDRR